MELYQKCISEWKGRQPIYERVKVQDGIVIDAWTDQIQGKIETSGTWERAASDKPVSWLIEQGFELKNGHFIEEMYTPAEIAEFTDTSEAQWRNKAAAGLLPGAIKKGKQWLIPRSAIEKI